MRIAGKRLLGRAFALLGTTLVAVGLLTVAPAREAAAAPSLPSGFVLTEQPSGQEPWNLTDFAYLPDGNGLLSTG
ncbi:hypothetical protein DES30_11366, partial [Prauserella marina]